MTREEAVREIYYWQYNWTSSFYNILLTLIHKADGPNKARLYLGFPEIFEAYMEWNDTPEQDDFFRKYGLIPTPRGDEEDDGNKE